MENAALGEVSIATVRHLARAIEELGVEPRALPPLLRAPAGMGLSAFACLWGGLVSAGGDASLPIAVADRARLDDFELLGYLAAACSTLDDALAALVDHSDLWISGASFQVVDGVTTKTLQLSIAQSRDRLGTRCVVEHMLAMVLRLLRVVARQELVPLLVRFAHLEPRPSERHHDFFGAPLVFGCSADEVVLDRGMLDIPISTSMPGLRSVLEAHATLRRSGRPTRARTSDRAREIILAQPDPRRIRPEDVASSLCCSERSLRRKLDREGTSFRELYDEILRGRAEQALGDGVGVETLARELGFEGRTAFARAFRRWTGMAPREYRAHAARASFTQR